MVRDDRRLPRRTALATLLRAVGAAIGLVLLYFTLPLDGRFGGLDVLLLPLGLAVFGMLTWYGIHRIIQSPAPRLMAVQVLATVFPLFIIVFASTYYLVSKHSPTDFSARLTRTDSLYFTMTVFSTVGFGDLVPVSQSARALVMVQMVGDLAVIGAGVHLLTGAVQLGEARRQRGGRLDRRPLSGDRANPVDQQVDRAP